MEAVATRSPLLVPGDGTVRTHSNSQIQLCPLWRSSPTSDEDDDDGGDVELVSNPQFSEGEKSCPEDGDFDASPMGAVAGSRSLSLQPWWARPSKRRGTCYLVYCVVCLLLTGILLVVNLWEMLAPRREARFWNRELRPWEEATEAFVGAALCMETFVVLIGLGPRAILRDRWRLIDAAIAALTLLCGMFFVFRRVIKGSRRMMEDVDVPILALRFALQPMRMVSTAAMVVRAQRRRKKRKPEVEMQELFDPRQLESLPANLRSALTPRLASDLRELLPCYLRYVEWNLGYAPKVHGTSLKTFYRRQAGPNLLVVRDAQGGLFGGFAPEAWRQQSGAYGTGESFIFAVHGGGASEEPAEASPAACASSSSGPTPCHTDEPPGHHDEGPPSNLAPEVGKDQRIEVFRATMQTGEAIQWSDAKMLRLGHALVVCEDFLRGTSDRCEAFGSNSPLSAAGSEFVISDFECWHIGTPHRAYIPEA